MRLGAVLVAIAVLAMAPRTAADLPQLHDPIVEPQQCADTGPVYAGDPSYPYVGTQVHDLTLAQIRTLDCGKPNRQFPQADVVQHNTIVTLSEVFSPADSYRADVRFTIETKVAADRPAISAEPQEFVDAVLAAVRSAGKVDNQTGHGGTARWLAHGVTKRYHPRHHLGEGTISAPNDSRGCWYY